MWAPGNVARLRFLAAVPRGIPHQAPGKSEDVPNLYFVGAGTHPGAGLPGVLSSAKIIDTLISALPEPRHAAGRRAQSAVGGMP